MGDVDRAITDFEAAISLNADSVSSWLALGDIHWKREHYDLAAKAFGEAIRLQPQNGAWYEVRGRVHWDAGDVKSALADIEMATKVTPWLAEVLGGERAILLSQNGRSPEGLAITNGLAETMPDEVVGYYCRAIIHLHMHRPEEAIADFDRAFALGAKDDRSASAFVFGRGVAKRMEGDFAGGDADLSAAILAEPTVAASLARLGVRP